jgi:CRP-like cAMP-binding protein
VFGHEYNPAIRHVNSVSSLKKIREFFFKNPVIRSFLKGIDKRDEKHIFNVMKITEFDNAERLIRKGTKDRSLIFVGAGQFMAFKVEKNEVFNEGAILGVSEFLKDSEWKSDIICSRPGFICKFTYESLLDLINQAPVSAIKMVRRITRH